MLAAHTGCQRVPAPHSPTAQPLEGATHPTQTVDERRLAWLTMPVGIWFSSWSLAICKSSVLSGIETAVRVYLILRFVSVLFRFCLRFCLFCQFWYLLRSSQIRYKMSARVFKSFMRDFFAVRFCFNNNCKFYTKI